MVAAGKDTVYVDVDDEITNVIDKVKTSPHKIVALVLPKRATVLQSVVNMKLLKRSAAAHKKSIVLITSEAGLLPLAGVAGLHVASSLQSKPAVPPLPDSALDDEAEIVVDDGTPLNKSASVGALAAAGAAGSAAATSGAGAAGVAARTASDDAADDNEVIELDNVTPEAAPTLKETAKAIKNKRLKVPNFDRFRKGVLFAILGGVLLISFWLYAAIVMPHATIAIKTDTSTVDVSSDFTVNSAAGTAFDLSKKQVPGVYKELKKTDTQKITATGTKDTGNKAKGTMTVTNCSDDDITLNAGTTFTNSGYSFTTDSEVIVPASDFFSNGTCKKNRNASVPVTAVNAGGSSNISGGRDYTTNIATTVTGKGSEMTGGTTNLVKIVSQTDIDNATTTMKGRLDSASFASLKTQFDKATLFALDATKVAGTPVVTSTPAVGAEANSDGSATVTADTTYSMLGIKKDYLSQIVKAEAGKKIDTKKQGISNDGLSDAQLSLSSSQPDNKGATMAVQAQVTAGPEIHPEDIKNMAKGKKRGDIEKKVGELPGVKEVTVSYSPFWVLSTPKASKKISVVVTKANDGDNTVDSNSGGL